MEENLLRFLSLLNICKFARKVTLGSNYLSKLLIINTVWRRERDSNPRYPFRHNGFQDRRYQPLTHPSARGTTLSLTVWGCCSSIHPTSAAGVAWSFNGRMSNGSTAAGFASRSLSNDIRALDFCVLLLCLAKKHGATKPLRRMFVDPGCGAACFVGSRQSRSSLCGVFRRV